MKKFKDTKYGDLTGKVYRDEIDINNIDLDSLEGAPKEVSEFFNCSINKLTSLKYAPQKINGWFDCSGNKLTTLEGSPKVDGHFYCRGNNLTSLKGAPKKVNGHFDCSNNKLTSLEGSPTEVNWNFYCGGNKLITLKGAPKDVDGLFYFNKNKKHWTIEYFAYNIFKYKVRAKSYEYNKKDYTSHELAKILKKHIERKNK